MVFHILAATKVSFYLLIKKKKSDSSAFVVGLLSTAITFAAEFS